MPETVGGSMTVEGAGSGTAARGDARAHDRLSAPGSVQPSTKRRSSSDTATLAPLHLLQHNRRGSITDPFLHAASAAVATASGGNSNQPSPRRSQSDSHSTRRLLDSPTVQRSPIPPVVSRPGEQGSHAGPSFMTSPLQQQPQRPEEGRGT
jgi:hypothetical protein